VGGVHDRVDQVPERIQEAGELKERGGVARREAADLGRRLGRIAPEGGLS
jgi:hypothetical protein